MIWLADTQKALNYIENNLTENIKADDIAKKIYASSDNFQRIFGIVTGYSMTEYIRLRRLSLAAQELRSGKCRVIDIAMKYGYDSPESFTRAFVRFHGITPSDAARRQESLKYFAPLTIKIDIRGGFDMQRKIIPNIPELLYDGNNVAYFTNILDAVLRGMNEPCDKAQITALSGEGNRFCWTDGEWVFGNECMETLNETPFEIEMRVLNGLGWKAKYFNILRDKEGNLLNTDAVQLRQEFMGAIDCGIAVMPRWGHFQIGYTVCFGYEDDGQKMIGWDYQNNTVEPASWGDWEQKITSYIILREKTKSKTEKYTALESFRNIVKHAKKSDNVNGRKVGFAAWESFLHHLEHDSFTGCVVFAADAPTIDNIANSIEHRFIIYCDGLCQIYARKSALPYYRRLAEIFPEWTERLNAAADAWDKCANYGGYLWSLGLSFDEAGYEKFRDPEVRKMLAEEGRRAMDLDKFAVDQIEYILANEAK